MSGKSRLFRALPRFVFLGVAACAIGMGALYILRVRRANMTRHTQIWLRQLQEATVLAGFTADPVLSFPKGNFADFMKWWSNTSYTTLFYHGDLNADELLRLHRDRWGRSPVYRFPPEDKDLIFELYSKGPNGRDERRGGDDIDGSPTFAENSYLFVNGVTDGEWIHKHIGQLQMLPGGKIPGAPPARLERSGEDAPAGANPEPEAVSRGIDLHDG
ncbi:MAG: hypothetical protein R6X20_09845 [Phycisphaerae bacterium]